MKEEQTPDDPSSEFDRILVEYYQRVDAGETIDKDQFLAEHPEHAEALAEFLSAEQQIQPEPADSTLQNTPTILGDNLKDSVGQNLPVLQYFGDYELLEEIARGGMGIVYKARQTSLNRIVAVKLILAGQLARDSDVQRFKAEAEAAAKLQHPNIVQIFEVGEHDGQHYFSMEYIDGSNLAQMVREYPLPAREAAGYVQKVADAIQYAHEQGVLHRDVKPSNVLVDSRGEMKVTDFGLAKLLEGDQQLTQTDQILGTPSYMPPEQALGNQALMGPTVDVYSLGAVLYHLLTGRPPFAAATQVETIHQVIHHEPVSPRLLEKSLPKDLETICQKCLQKEPHRRYARSQDLAEDLQRFLDGRPVVARPVSRLEKAGRWCKRNPVVASLTTAVMILLLILGIAGPIVAVQQAELAHNNKTLAIDEGKAKDEAQKKTKELGKKTQELTETSNQLINQLAVATASRLAAQSQSVAETFPVRSLLLGIESIKATRRHDGTEISAAHQSLLDGLSRVGGQPLFGDHTKVISPDGRWLVTGNWKTAWLWDLTAEDPTSSSRVLRGHEDKISSVAISPDGHWLVTGSYDHTARLWDLTAEDPTSSSRVLRGHEDKISSVAISPDGHWLVTSSRDGPVRLWDWTAEDPTSSSIVLRGHDRGVRSVTISPDGRWLVTRGRDGPARLWDLTAEDPASSARVIRGQNDDLSYVAISPDGRWLVTDSRDGTVRLWDLTAEDPASSAWVLRRHDEFLWFVAISPDGRWLVTSSRDGPVRLWDLTAEDPTSSARVIRGHDEFLWGVVISPDSRWLVTGNSHGTVRLWDLTAEDPASSSRLLRGHDHAVSCLAISSDGRWLVTGSSDHTARVQDLTAEDPGATTRVLKGPGGVVTSVTISPDGRWLVTGNGHRTVRLWDLTAEDAGSSARVLRGHDESLWHVAISPDGHWLVTYDDGTVRLRDLTTEDPVATTLVRHSGYSVSISPDSHWLVMGDIDGTVRLWDLTAKNPGSSARVFRGHDDVVGCLAISSDGRWLVTGSWDRTARLWDLTAEDPASSSRVLRGHESIVSSVAISPDGRWLVTGSADHTARLWDLTAEDPASSARVLRGHENAVLCLAISPDSRWLVTGSWDRTARLWDLTAEDPTSSSRVLRGHEDKISSVAIGPDGHWLVTGSYDHTARLWDLTAEDLTSSSRVLRGHGRGVEDNFDHGVEDVAISPDGRWLVTGSYDHTARLWDLTAEEPASSARVLRGHENAVLCLAISPDSRWLVTGSADGTARLWDLEIDALIERAKRVAGRDLTPEERKQYLLD